MYYNGTAEIYNAWMNGMYELLFWYALIALAYLLIIGLIWGIVVQKVVENRGYNENWFIWGFFFHIFALIVALTKPNRNVYPPLYSTNRVEMPLRTYKLAIYKNLCMRQAI